MTVKKILTQNFLVGMMGFIFLCSSEKILQLIARWIFLLIGLHLNCYLVLVVAFVFFFLLS